MKKLLVVVFFLVLMSTFTDTSPILTEKDAKQILRTRREDRLRKAGFPDEPMRDMKSAVYLAGLSSVCARIVETASGFPFPMVIVYPPKRIHLAVRHSQCTLFFVKCDGHNKSKLSQGYCTMLVNSLLQRRLYNSVKKTEGMGFTAAHNIQDWEHMLYLQRLEQRSEEQFLEHWLNPHCLPHCNRDLVHPI